MLRLDGGRVLVIFFFIFGFGVLVRESDDSLGWMLDLGGKEYDRVERV